MGPPVTTPDVLFPWTQRIKNIHIHEMCIEDIENKIESNILTRESTSGSAI